MNNNNNSYSSPSSAAANSPYSSLNMTSSSHFINQEQMEKDLWKYDSSGDDRVDHGSSSGTVLKRGGDEVNESVSEKVEGRKPVEKKVRKAKHAFQTRSQVDILDDGYRWRKYGQKAVKNNKFPRNYYRCTHQGCNVKKQVQRLSHDEGVVVTTYEGVHSHPIEKSTDNFENILTQMQIYPG